MTAILLRRKKLGAASCTGISEKSQQGIYTVRNWVDDDVPAGVDAEGYVFRWGCTSTLPTVYNHRTVVNEAKAIHWCTDKRASRLAMQEAGVSVPKTWGSEEDFGEQLFPRGYPIEYNGPMYVARKSQHAQGRDLVYGNPAVVAQALLNWEEGYISEFINKVAEYRVYVVQGRAVGVGNKTPADPTAIAWNMAQGGSFANVRWGSWPLAVVEEALKAVAISGLDFAGADVMVDADGKVYVLELNSAPSLGPYMQGCFAKAFDYIIANGKEALPPIRVWKRWQSYVHPAIWSG